MQQFEVRCQRAAHGTVKGEIVLFNISISIDWSFILWKRCLVAWRCHTHNSSQNMSLILLHWAVIMGVFQPNQEKKCLFAQLDRPTTNQSNVVCDVC